MKKSLPDLFAGFGQSFWKHYVSLTLLLTATFTVLYALLIYFMQGEFFYADTDCYTRALRIVDWLQDFSWQEKIFPYTNHPDGFVLHFTRICDVIWLIFTLPFLTFSPLKEAVFYGGFFFSPLFLFLTLIAFLWGVKPYLASLKHCNGLFLTIFAFAFAFCCKLTAVFDFYRPDHHCIMCFVFSFCLSVLLRSYLKPNTKEFFFAGVLTGLGLWASSAPEGLYIALIVLFISTTDVIFSEKSTKNPLCYTLGFFYATLFAWLINPPLGGYAVTDNARLSIIHVALSALMLASFAAWHLANFKGKFKQISSLGFFAVASAVFMLILFGSETLFASVYAEEVKKYFVSRIDEMDIIENIFMVPVVIGMIIASYMSFNKPHERCLALLYLFTAPLGMWISRFYSYYLCVWLVLYASGLVFLFVKKDTDAKLKPVAFIYVLLPVFYFALFDYKPEIAPDMKVSGVVLADTFEGPELVWRYNVDTVASPYHTNIEGIKDNHIMWFTSDENELKELLKKREVTYITLKGVIKSEYYASPEDNTDKLYGKVFTGKDIYPWMEKIDERTYRVNYEKF